MPRSPIPPELKHCTSCGKVVGPHGGWFGAECHCEWNAVNNKALLLYKRRKVLAHGLVFGGSDGVPAAIGYSMFDERSRKTMSYVQVCAQAPAFEKFESRVTALAVAMNRPLAEHPRPTATVPVFDTP